jgi:hypothetical protein
MKIVIGFVAALGVLVAGCSCTPQQTYNDPGYGQPVQQGFVQQHGDAVVAGAVGYLAGRALAKRNQQRVAPTYARPNYGTYAVAPVARPAYRSSGFGSYRSTRRR